MSRIIPPPVWNEVCTEVGKLADLHKYLFKDRAENNRFIDELVKHPKVGQRLSEFMSADAARVWIKDVALNGYSKRKRQPPRCIKLFLKRNVGKDAHELDYFAKDRLSLHWVGDGEYLLVARTTYVKWETGLRKLIVHMASRPPSTLKQATNWRLLLLIHLAEGETVNAGDRKVLQRALALINVTAMWSDD